MLIYNILNIHKVNWKYSCHTATYIPQTEHLLTFLRSDEKTYNNEGCDIQCQTNSHHHLSYSPWAGESSLLYNPLRRQIKSCPICIWRDVCSREHDLCSDLWNVARLISAKASLYRKQIWFYIWVVIFYMNAAYCGEIISAKSQHPRETHTRLLWTVYNHQMCSKGMKVCRN